PGRCGAPLRVQAAVAAVAFPGPPRFPALGRRARRPGPRRAAAPAVHRRPAGAADRPHGRARVVRAEDNPYRASRIEALGFRFAAGGLDDMLGPVLPPGRRVATLRA